MKILLAPHNDDESLFAAHLCIRERPHIVVCLQSRLQDWQGVTAAVREAETACAASHLGCTWEQWPYIDVDPSWGQVEAELRDLAASHRPDVVYAPAVDFEANGHQPGAPPELFGVLHHDYVGYLADRVFDNVVHYQTYTRWGGRVREGTRVTLTPQEHGTKVAALSCYQSQIQLASTGHHFAEVDREEWLA